MKKLFTIIFFFLMVSCKKEIEIEPCLQNPILDNSTLKRIIDLDIKHNLDSNSVNLYSNYNSLLRKHENYFVVSNRSPVLKYHFIQNAEIINCEGNDIAEYFHKNEYDDFFRTAKFVRRIWKKEKSKFIESKGTCNTLNPLLDIPYFVKLNANLDKYAWKSIIYQYNYNGQTIYYGLYTSIDKKETKYVSLAAMTCDGTNLQELPNWNQAHFLTNAILERQIR